MKKEVVGLIFVLMLSVPFASAGFFDWVKEKVQLAPSQPTDVRVQVGNVAPTITSISAIPAVNLNPSPSTTTVVFTFTANDKNSAADIDDTTASANFNKVGEATRSATCSFQSQSGKSKTYQCSVVMQYYDGSGTWNVAVSVKDNSGAMGSSASTFTVNLLRDISLSPAIIGFPSVAQDDIDVVASVPTIVTNNGNFVVPSDGNLKVTSLDLQGETNPAEVIPASNFKVSGSSGSATVCATGSSLTASSAVSITSANLPRGPSGSNTEQITYCLTLVPSAISTQFYSAIGGRAWVVGI